MLRTRLSAILLALPVSIGLYKHAEIFRRRLRQLVERLPLFFAAAINPPPPTPAGMPRVHPDAPPLPPELSFIHDDDDDDDAALKMFLEEQMSRNTTFLGSDGQQRVASSSVTVVGLGAVGSHCAALLARTGVEKLRLIDPAMVTTNSMRTHAVAEQSDVGVLSKAAATKRVMATIVPGTVIDVVEIALDGTNAESLLSGASYVVVAIPSAPPPSSSCPVAAAIIACQKLAIPCLPILYADAALGLKTVAHQRYSLLQEVCGCIQARTLCSTLRALLPKQPHMPCGQVCVIHSGVDSPCVHLSSESPYRPLPGEREVRLPQAEGAWMAGPLAGAYGALSSLEISAVGAVLAGMGDAAASVVIAELADDGSGKSKNTPSGGFYTKSNRDDAHRALLRRERDAFHRKVLLSSDDPTAPSNKDLEVMDVWPEDLEYHVMEVWGGRCAVTNASLGGGQALVFTRYDRNKPASVGNIVLMSKAAAEAHDRAEAPLEAIDASRRHAIEAALREAVDERREWSGA